AEPAGRPAREHLRALRPAAQSGDLAHRAGMRGALARALDLHIVHLHRERFGILRRFGALRIRRRDAHRDADHGPSGRRAHRAPGRARIRTAAALGRTDAAPRNAVKATELVRERRQGLPVDRDGRIDQAVVDSGMVPDADPDAIAYAPSERNSGIAPSISAPEMSSAPV